jgi:hypothetical protein
MQFGFVASWQAFHNAIREKHSLLHQDDDLLKDFLFMPHFTIVDFG